MQADLKSKLQGILLAQLTVLEPYHDLCVSLFRIAADPQSALNPFGPESEPIRLKAVELYRRLLIESSEQMPTDLIDELPFLLFLYQMGINLYWIHDRTTGRVRTHALIRKSVDLVVTTIKIIGMPVMRPVRKNVLKLINELTAELALQPARTNEAGDPHREPS